MHYFAPMIDDVIPAFFWNAIALEILIRSKLRDILTKYWAYLLSMVMFYVCAERF